VQSFDLWLHSWIYSLLCFYLLFCLLVGLVIIMIGFVSVSDYC
jgi:hypothetical protein